MSDIIYGVHAARARLQSGLGIRRLVLRKGKLGQRLEELVKVADTAGCPVERGDVDEVLGPDITHQGVALYVDPVAMLSSTDLERLVGDNHGSLLLLILDGVTDPRNLGACVRSAASMGVNAIVVPKDNSAALNEAAIKVASGGAQIVPVVQVVNLARTLDYLKTAGIWVVGTVLEDVPPIAEIDLTGHVALVMGSEGSGIRRKTRDRCDFLARIPMSYENLGLNVSVATGICLYEAQKQRLKPA
jgi:23S rRNA (guanosine2251-2'-O)-methyltransferase